MQAGANGVETARRPDDGLHVRLEIAQPHFVSHVGGFASVPDGADRRD